MEIHVLHRQGMSIRAIAKQLHLSRNTVRRYLRNIAKTPRYSQRTTPLSKLDPFKFYLLERIKAAKPDWIPATVLFRELQARGYGGKDGILRNYIWQFKTKTEEPVQRFETPAGKQLQVDFTTIRRGKKKLKALVATLGYSRATDVLFSQHERQEDGLHGTEAVLDYFWGVSQQLLFDIDERHNNDYTLY
ncbi:helix-turn-helix domain-containing protein [Candidatus Fukatsuia endosymbiont of Tuberolachnus salignus]|uniref:helix-turn-helix domain-containing protein n=1 Tax=Candidatus Fukatsuia endosymbiont of Tuberolachnus salignus TaxID=3077957 RepID=UPI001967CEDB